MSPFARVEFTVGPRLRSRRIVLLVEFSDKALQRIEKEKASREVEAYNIALEAIRALNLGSLPRDMNLITSTQGRVKDRSRLDEPTYVTEEGCHTWVIKRPWTDHP